ncbi:hypothetical protein KLP28_01010 [Nocardioidaceae bacterium]|nr:hypothetical protein KLP28_01010 [Nocardioidaceae bacterium]
MPHAGEIVTNYSGHRRHHASSPFAPEAEVPVVDYAVGDRVCHDAFGMGRVVTCEAQAIGVDFGDAVRRLVSPYARLEHL